MASVLQDPAIQTALQAVDTVQTALTADSSTQADASQKLTAAQQGKDKADAAVATDQQHLQDAATSLYGAIFNATGVTPALPPAPAPPAPIPAGNATPGT